MAKVPPAEPLSLSAPALRWDSGRKWEVGEQVAREEPLELRVLTAAGEQTLTVLMRTPGQDTELLTGWLVAEGALPAEFTLRPHPENPNVWWLQTPDPTPALAAARLGTASSACGVCGSGSIERLAVRAAAARWEGGSLSAAWLSSLPARLLEHQPGFHATGGLHGAALFGASGDLLAAAEDVGRHNAVDKVIGQVYRQLPLSRAALCVSSRAGFEIVQKAVMAGVAVVVCVGAPSSLALDTAQTFGVTLCGFTREGRTTVYSGFERLSE